jgi:hypothetical protein
MHPEIEQFWKEAGYHYISNKDGSSLIGSVSGYKKVSGFADRVDLLGFDNAWRLNGRWYSEEKLLKIIKMKAFL